MANTIKLQIIDLKGKTQELAVAPGANLRQVLLEEGISPYVSFTEKLNCGGRGLCATCGVWIEPAEPRPFHWHAGVPASTIVRCLS